MVNGEDITLKKYSQIENLESIANMYAESFYQVLKYNVIITDTDKIVGKNNNVLKNLYPFGSISNNSAKNNGMIINSGTEINTNKHVFFKPIIKYL